ncbi:MAG: nucleotidyltransferase domain-containing protein [Cyanobacteria bacterium J06621_8]
MQAKVNLFLSKVISWASKEDSVLGVSLVGSYARNQARPDSDVDLVILSHQPSKLLAENEWILEFGNPISNRHGDYGLVQSKHVLYEDGLNVEYGITTLEWANIEPVDRGTYKVIIDGMRILYDPKNIFQSLQNAINSSG